MSPFAKVEVDVFTEIVQILRRWAESLERHLQAGAGRQIGPAWAEEDLTELYRAWLQVGGAIRDVARNAPHESQAEVRQEILAVRDGLQLISEILGRQASPGA